MESNKQLFWNNAMFWGLIVGVGTIVITAIFYFAGGFFSPFMGLINFAISITSIVLGAKAYREAIKANDPFPYRKALGLGVATMFFASILVALFYFVLHKFIDTSLIDKQITILEESSLKMGMSEDFVEQYISSERTKMTAYSIALNQIFGLTIYGLIISLITSIFTKKKETDPFKAAMSGIDEEE